MCYRKKISLPTNRTADGKGVKYPNFYGFEIIRGEYAIKTLSNQQLDDLRSLVAFLGPIQLTFHHHIWQFGTITIAYLLPNLYRFTDKFSKNYREEIFC